MAPSVTTAFVAVGTNFADALSASAYAAKIGAPILLTEPGRLPAETNAALQSLATTKTWIIGGDAVIKKQVFTQLPGGERIYGSDRYATGVALANHFLPTSTKQVYIATGLNFPDAVAGGVLAARGDSGVLLTRGDKSLPDSSVQNFLVARGINSASIFGGSSAVSAGIEDWLKANIQ